MRWRGFATVAGVRHLSKQILSIHRRVLGDDYRDTLSSMAKVADTRRKLEDKL
jgi:hypothetical protein